MWRKRTKSNRPAFRRREFKERFLTSGSFSPPSPPGISRRRANPDLRLEDSTHAVHFSDVMTFGFSLCAR